MRIFFLVKGRAIELRWSGNNQVYSFAPVADVPEQFAQQLLKKSYTRGGCCGHPEKTSFMFATEDQLASGERSWIE